MYSKLGSLLVFGVIFSGISYAEIESAKHSDAQSIIAKSRENRWALAGHFEASPMAAGNSPVFGPSLTYKVMGNWELGIKALMSVSATVDRAYYSAHVLTRVPVVGGDTRFFIEASVAYNMIHYKEVKSFASMLGVQHQLSTLVSLGGTAGFDFSPVLIESNQVKKNDSIWWFYPRVALYGSFEF